MCRYLVIDWELKSIWITDDINDVNDGGSYRYKNDEEMIKDIKDIIKEIKK